MTKFDLDPPLSRSIARRRRRRRTAGKTGRRKRKRKVKCRCLAAIQTLEKFLKALVSLYIYIHTYTN